MLEEALEIATDADYKFDLAMQLGKLEVAKVLVMLSLIFLSPNIVDYILMFFYTALLQNY